MKGLCLSIIFLLTVTIVPAQVAFRTVVPQKPVVVGESFPVQYILQDAEDAGQFTAPDFPGFKLVSGPSIYHGSVSTAYGVKPLINTVYTLVPLKPGRFTIQGATAILFGEPVRSNDNIVEVITRDEALRRMSNDPGTVASDYFLAPGEDPYEKVKKNLFLKVMVDRTSCYVGEPVLATFKLYSRLESKSDIVKNPGFYGFTVFDMVNLADKQSTQEKVNGQLFDVHTIRKVQLYPLQSGDFTIDRMEVKNRVEFSRSAVRRKTEQEIVEGVLGYDEEPLPENGAEYVETEMHTEPTLIRVKPLPASKTKPDDYSGAVGNFSIRSTVLKDNLARNQEGIFEVTISGQGNFIQLPPPQIKWPAGVEGFDPVLQDVLDKNENPLKGRRVYRYTFVSSAAGDYTIPPIEFSFFRPDSGNFKTIQTAATQIHISNEVRQPDANHPIVTHKEYKVNWGTIAAILLVIGSVILLYSLRRKRHQEHEKIIPEEKPSPGVRDYLEPAAQKLSATDREFFTALHGSAWNFLAELLSLKGSEMNKRNLGLRLSNAKVDNSTRDEMINLIGLIETGMFTTADLSIEKNALLEQSTSLLEKIKQQVNAG